MGTTAVITGGTDGIGKEIARGLLHHGATVVIGARNLKKGEAVRAELSKEPGGGSLRILPLDVSDLASVRDFAAAVASEYQTLQLLINNAGAMFDQRRETPEGHELTLATNVLGPYLLTRLLLPRLLAGRPARIVNLVSSLAGNYDASDLEWKRRKYDGFKAYGQSKRAVRMITWQLAKRLEGSGVVVNAVSPGFVNTTFLATSKSFLAIMLRVMSIFASSPEKGASTPLWVATAPELSQVSGKYFESHKEKEDRFREQPLLDVLETLLDKMTDMPKLGIISVV